MRTVRAVEFTRPMITGSKNPALFLCDGQRGPEEVVVKFREILLRHEFSCVGETVAALLAGTLGFRYAEPVAVELCADLAEFARSSEWPEYGQRIERSEGLNFGSVFAGTGMDARLPSDTDGPELRSFWQDLLCFDFVIQNFDRVRENPNYLRRGDQVTIIDHEQAFRHLDDGETGPFTGRALAVDPFFRHVSFLTFDFATSFDPFFTSLSMLRDEQIANYFAQLPKEWCDHRSARLEQYLHWAKSHTEELCERLTTILPP